MMERIKVYREDGFEVWVELSHDLNKYAMDFLHIFNNVKGEDWLIRVWNDYGNTVYVTCKDESDCHKALVEYLSQFGTIRSDRRVQIMYVDAFGSDIECDYEKYHDLILCPVLD